MQSSDLMNCRLVYVITPSHEEALKVGRKILEARLAACANILAPIHSVYWWQDRLEEGHEVALLLKTRGDLVDQIVTTVQNLHSHACPCVIALPIVAGNPAFLQWITTETQMVAAP